MEEKNEALSGGGDLLKMFQRDAIRRPVLSREESENLARRAQAGDQAATDLLVESNLRIVLRFAFRYWHPGLPLMDLISAGCIGLWKAVIKHDPSRGAFSTYAFARVEWSMLRELNSHYSYLQKHKSLDDPIYNDDETTFKDLLPSHTRGADDLVFSQQVLKMLSNLDDREKRILYLRFWCDLGYPEISKKIGSTVETVRQTEIKALRKLRWTRRIDLGMDRVGSDEINMKMEVNA